MSEAALFEQVAAGNISLADAVSFLLQQDEAQRRLAFEEDRPSWMPAVIWDLLWRAISFLFG
jgi:hypothetical protein